MVNEERSKEEDGVPEFPLDENEIPIIERFWYVPPKEVRKEFAEAMRVEIRTRPKDMVDAILIRWVRDLRQSKELVKRGLEGERKIPVYAEGIRSKEVEQGKRQNDGQ